MVSAADIQELGRYKTALVLVFSGIAKQLLANANKLIIAVLRSEKRNVKPDGKLTRPYTATTATPK